MTGKKSAAYSARLKHADPMDLVFGSGEDSSQKLMNEASLPISKIAINPHQPRKYFDPGKLEELSNSIKQLGVLEPLLVRPTAKGIYELVAGERRLKAARQAGLTEVPCFIKEMDDETVRQASLVENLQREDLNAYEETVGILELLVITLNMKDSEVIALLNRMEKVKRNSDRSNPLDESTIEKVERVFATIGKLSPDSYRANRLPLLNLPEDIKAALASGQIEYTKARAIAKLKDAQLREQLLKEAIEKGLSLAEIKQRIDENQSSKLEQQSPSLKDAYKSLSRELAKSSVWEDPKKKKALNKLLAQIQSLLFQDGG